MMKSFYRFEACLLDWNLPPIPFNDASLKETYSKPLTIGYFADLPYLKATDAVTRAVNIAKEALEKKGHTLIPFQLTKEEYYTFKMFFFVNTNVSFIP